MLMQASNTLNFDPDNHPHMRGGDRILVLKEIEGKKVLSSTGLVDPRLFKGGNTLHAIMEPRSCLWSFKYDSGGLPEALKQSFTSFKKLKEFADVYFKNRGLHISEVKD